MIKITHKNIDQISNLYTSDVLAEIATRINGIRDFLQLLHTTNNIEQRHLGGKIQKYARACKVLVNDGSLKISKTQELLNYITANHAILLANLQIIEHEVRVFDDINLLRQVISSKPHELKRLSSTLERRITIGVDHYLYSYLFDYTGYYNDFINPAFKKLELTVCPYCNRNFITNVGPANDRTIGPTFDHFFDKATYPLLAISFYNLIPSCYICNSNLKGSIPFDIDTHLHPYINEMGDDAVFDFDLKIARNSKTDEIAFAPKLEVKIQESNANYQRLLGKANEINTGSIKVFKLKEIYATHSDTVKDVYDKFDKNNKYYSKSIIDLIKAVGADEAEFYRFYFNNYYKTEDFNKRPLAKLSSDIYKKMKAISKQ
ncbi:MAG: HAMP domain-containing histidine kinase [Bacteroidetes bacterium]|nr:HAMP domain-containing histidine kinase [Bacteroidota bacterium]